MGTTIIIPAFNEEQTLGNVLAQVIDADFIEQVIVVDDGSEDYTAQVAKSFANVILISLPQNQGKAAAMLAGARYASSDNILFLDADLIGLTHQHLRDLIQPVAEGRVDMSVGMFGKGRILTDIAQIVTPVLSGQRCLSRKLAIDVLANAGNCRYGIEVFITKYAKDHNLTDEIVEMPHVSQVMKEEKMGFKKGTAARWKMYQDIFRVLTR